MPRDPWRRAARPLKDPELGYQTGEGPAPAGGRGRGLCARKGAHTKRKLDRLSKKRVVGESNHG